jgi:tetratricopeptide (TPR) repeat protein
LLTILTQKNHLISFDENLEKENEENLNLDNILDIKKQDNQYYILNLEHKNKTYFTRMVNLDESFAFLSNLNIGQCFLKMGKYTKCLEYCNRALSIDSSNIKGRLRRCFAYLELGDSYNARKDLEFVSKKYPNDGGVKLAFKKLRELEEKDKKKEKKAMKNIFSGLSEE